MKNKEHPIRFDNSIYNGYKVLITGGLGFLGSNIAHYLVKLGARVTLLDALLPNNGGNPRNISGIEDKVEVVIDDIRNKDVINTLVVDKDIIFNLAGQVSYIDSMNDPFLDMDISCRGHINILEACRLYNQKVRIMFASSRMVYARGLTNPVSETAATEPLSIYGIHKLAGEKYHKLYYEAYDISTVCLRITNPYGPRQRVEGGKYGIVNWFLRQAMKGETLRVFGDGKQLRDYIYIDDLVEIFLRLGITPGVSGKVYNAGSGKGTAFKEMVQGVIECANGGKIENVDWPQNYSRLETGNFIADTAEFCNVAGKIPLHPLSEGLMKTIAFYREEY